MPRGHSPHIPARPAPRPDRAPGTPRSDSPPISRPGGPGGKAPAGGLPGPLISAPPPPVLLARPLPADLYRIKDAAAMIGVRPPAIIRLIRAGVIPTYGRHGYYHVSLADLLPRYDRPRRHPIDPPKKPKKKCAVNAAS